jgi:hypothetical protein
VGRQRRECTAGARLFVFLGFVEFGRITEAENLTRGVPLENTMRPLRFERNYRDVPGSGTVRRRNASARQPLERFKLEDGARRRRPDGAERSRLD